MLFSRVLIPSLAFFRFLRCVPSIIPQSKFLKYTAAALTVPKICKMSDKPYSEMTDADWKAKGLSKEAIAVTRHAGTERPGTSPLYQHKESGVYHCVCCGTPLFKSAHKFQSSCGWPAFYADSFDAMIEKVDMSHGMKRVEVLCKTCGAHLGHKFDDAKHHNKTVPVDTRYCINGVSLEFQKAT